MWCQQTQTQRGVNFHEREREYYDEYTHSATVHFVRVSLTVVVSNKMNTEYQNFLVSAFFAVTKFSFTRTHKILL